ncbi:MAG: hypothetical protein K6E18_01295 [Lachnospiraceae bacterium]|nr:hypothetical protein [Lachnospiraceae bacterium]
MSEEKKAREEMVEHYRDEVMRLAAYIPWLEEKSGNAVSSTYNPEGGKTITFPVYDSMLLQFVRAMDDSIFIDKNYPYVYSRYGLKTAADEIRLIERTDIMNLAVIGGILSRYILVGRTKGKVWSDGVVNGVYLKALQRAKDLIEFYDLKEQE